MKTKIKIIAFFILNTSITYSQSIGIGTTLPESSAVLDISSTTKGLRIPYMETSDRLAISDPANGLLVYDKNETAFYYFKDDHWTRIVEIDSLNNNGIAGGDLDGVYPNPIVDTGAINSIKILDGSVAGIDIQNNSISSAKVIDGTIVNIDLANNAITSNKIADGNVGEDDLDEGAVTSVKIKDFTIATIDLANDAVINNKLANNAVSSDKIADLTIINNDIADGTLTTSKLNISGETVGEVLQINDSGEATWKEAPIQKKIADFDSNTKIEVEKTANENKIRFTTNGQERIIIDNTGHVGIGISSPHSAAALEISSNDKGLLPPRMTSASRNAISNPPNGLIVFDTDKQCLFLRQGNVWFPLSVDVSNNKIQKVPSYGNSNSDNFGSSVSIDPPFAIVGDPDFSGGGFTNNGSITIFFDNNGTWAFYQKIDNPNPSNQDMFGFKVAIYDSTLVVSCPGDNNTFTDQGSIYIFDYTPSGFVQTDQVFDSNPQQDARFGEALDMYKDIILVGSPKYNVGANTNAGRLELISLLGGNWVTNGSINGTQTNGNFGFSVARDSLVMTIGEPGFDNGGLTDVGRVHRYGNNTAAFISSFTGNIEDLRLGHEVDIKNDTVLVSGIGNASVNGKAYLLKMQSSVSTISAVDGVLAGQEFGGDVSFQSSSAFVTSPLADDGLKQNCGGLFEYQKSSQSYNLKDIINYDDSRPNLFFGRSIDCKNKTCIVSSGDDLDINIYFINF